MATKKVATSIWVYFAKTENPEKVKCKICKKRLGSNRSHNLQQHLNVIHKLEVRLSRKRGLQHVDLGSKIIKPEWTDETITPTSTTRVYDNLPDENYTQTEDNTQSEDNSYDIITRTLESNESFVTESVSCPALIIKQEVLFDPENPQSSNLLEIISDENALVKEIKAPAQGNIDDEMHDINTVAPRVILPTNDVPSLYYPPAAVSNNNVEFMEPLPKTKEKAADHRNESPIASISDDFELFPKKKNRINMAKDKPISSDILNETLTCSIEGNFEKLFKKRKQTLELECLEMQNYKIKLEIWEIEQKLQLQCSKFTKNIIARSKKPENFTINLE